MQPAADLTELNRLLQEAQSGDGSAYAAIIRSRQAMVYSIARNFLRNPTHAEDIAQDVFLELHRNLQSIESGSHLISWLRQVAGRKCIDQSRRAWFRRWVDLDDGSNHGPESEAAGAEPHDPLLSGRIHEAMGKLPEKTRLMMIMRYQEEMEPNEIADSMQVPVGTVKSTIHRGLEQLRRRLAAVVVHRGRKPWISLKTI
jgi:RNA polymerase sigma-70 factor, ECF subfamily